MAKEKKTPRTIRCEDSKWAAFINLAERFDTNASEAILGFIDKCLREQRIPKQTPESEHLEAITAELVAMRERLDRMEKTEPAIAA